MWLIYARTDWTSINNANTPVINNPFAYFYARIFAHLTIVHTDLSSNLRFTYVIRSLEIKLSSILNSSFWTEIFSRGKKEKQRLRKFRKSWLILRTNFHSIWIQITIFTNIRNLIIAQTNASIRSNDLSAENFKTTISPSISPSTSQQKKKSATVVSRVIEQLAATSYPAIYRNLGKKARGRWERSRKSPRQKEMACGKTAGEQGGEKGGEAVKSVDVAVTFSVSSLKKSSRARNRETFVSPSPPLSLSLFLAREIDWGYCWSGVLRKKKAMKGCD